MAGNRLVCQRGFTAVLAARKGSDAPTSIVKSVQNQFFITSKNDPLGFCSESGFQLLMKNLRNYHITPHVSRGKVEYVAGDSVRKPKLNPILKQDVVILIDEEGKNLGRMDSKMALGMAEGRGFKVEHVGNQRKPVNNSIDENVPVFKMAGITAHDESQSNKKNLRKSSSEVVKEIHFGTKITDHDKLNKLRYVVDVLERGKSVRVFSEVRAKGKWMSSEVYEEELKMRETILDNVEEHLKGIGVREKELKAKGKMIFAHFKPSPKVLQRRADVIKERAENMMMKKKKKWQKKEEREVEEKEKVTGKEELEGDKN